MAGKFSIYKYVKLGQGLALLQSCVSPERKNQTEYRDRCERKVEEKHAEGAISSTSTTGGSRSARMRSRPSANAW